MNKLAKLRARLKTLVDGLTVLKGKEDLTTEEMSQITKDIAEIEGIEAEIKTLEAAEQAIQRAGNTPLDDEDADESFEIQFPRRRETLPAAARDKSIPENVEKIGALCVATAIHKASPAIYKSPLDVLAKHGMSVIAEDVRGATTRALQAGTAAAGGLLVPDNWSQDIIEFLRPQTAFLRAGPRMVPMPGGSYRQSGGATGATAGYGVELQNARVTEPTFREINMVAKELKALVPMSNQFLDFSIASARAFVQQDLRDAMTEAMDQHAFIGDGQQGRPLGIFEIDGITVIDYEGDSTPTVVELDALANQFLGEMEDRNVPMGTAAWIMGSKARRYIGSLRAGVSEAWAYPEMRGQNPRWFDLPAYVTTNISQTYGLGGNESYLGLVAWRDVLMGDAGGLSVQTSTEAAYYDAQGVLRTAFQSGQTLILMQMRHDFALRHLPSVVVSRNITIGA